MATDKQFGPAQRYADAQEQPRQDAPRSGAPPRRPGLMHGFRALRNRNYRLYATGQIVSLTGSWMQTTAQSWLVLELTKSPFALGLVATLQFLPIMLLSLFGGVIVDRMPKHRLVLITQSAGLIQAALFWVLVATGAIQLWHVYILAAMQGTITAIDNPARQTFSAELVGRDNLVNAVALNSMQFNLARIIGPAVAGVAIAALGFAPVLLANTISFVAVLAGLLMMDPREFHSAPPRPQGRVLQELAEGLRYSWRTPRVLLIMILIAAIGTFGYNFGVVLPLLAGFVLHTDSAGFGGLSAFLGVGSLAAALATAYSSRLTTKRLLVSALAFSLLFAAVAVTPVLALSAVLLIALGFAGISFTTTANTMLQLHVPDELRGRVMSLYMLLFAGSTPIGAFLIGTLSERIGVSATLLICGALCGLGVGVAYLYQKKTEEGREK
ncbi:MAG TPA: MFS transporter [Roseiflexaceae bacterium]|nr:MFS transporter [Roseiflexaceae bacterium]